MWCRSLLCRSHWALFERVKTLRKTDAHQYVHTPTAAHAGISCVGSYPSLPPLSITMMALIILIMGWLSQHSKPIPHCSAILLHLLAFTTLACILTCTLLVLDPLRWGASMGSAK